MKNLLLFVTGLLAVVRLTAQSLPEKQFSHPERVRYDQDCFTIEGKDIFILSAAFHYFRCPQELWRDRFQKIKEAGFNTVETYVPWNWHERNMPEGLDDYSQCNFDDLKAWLKMAHEDFGLYTIVRPGPFICAEWAGGAYPRWLAKFCPEKYETSFWLRSNHPEHIRWARHWYNAVCPVFAAEQLSRKPRGEKGIIMVQLENEYVYFGMSSRGKVEVLTALADACHANGIDVPLFTCVTPEVRGSHDPVISQLFDMDNQYVWWNIQEAKTRLEDLKKQQPNAPAFVCELQGGWFSTVGGGLSEDNHLDGRHARGMALMGMAGGGTGLNYYMFFGGTNLAGWGARRMTTTYDYGAPLKETGGVDEKYAAVKGIGEIVEKFGAEIARSRAVGFTASVDPSELVVGVRKSPQGRLFYFFFNPDRSKNFDGEVELRMSDGKVQKIRCQLNPSDSKMLVAQASQPAMGGEWYPRPQALPRRPAQLPEAVRISQAWSRPETFGGNWKQLPQNMSLPELGVNDCRYSMYRSEVTLSPGELEKYGTMVFSMFTDDPMYVQVNGKPLKRASADELNNTFLLGNTLQKGKNEIVAIYENQGHAHGYRPMEELSGMRAGGLGNIPLEMKAVEEWQVKSVTDAGQDALLSAMSRKEGWEKIMLDEKTIAGLATLQIAGLQKPEWPAAWILQGKSGMALYRTVLRFTPEMIREKRTILQFDCVDDEGTLWVNGREVARHSDWATPFIADIAPYVKPGENTVAILVRNNSGAGGLLKGVRLQGELRMVRPLDWEVSTDLGGVCEGVVESKYKCRGWKTVTLDSQQPIARKGGKQVVPQGKHDGLLTWYRVEFNLPRAEAGVWIPWRALVSASGTGYIWLNGHNIGRYWEQGPQREFYLPECWLNFGGKNTMVLGLRQSEDKGALLRALEIAPYGDDAEVRK